MHYLETFLKSNTLLQLSPGQLFVMLLGLWLIYLGIKKKLEPLLLIAIGFAAILSNVPGSGIALSTFDSALASGDHAALMDIAIALKIETIDATSLAGAFAQALPETQQYILRMLEHHGYRTGFFRLLYDYAVGSGVAPMLIFLGIGAMSNLSALIARPKILLLGLAAQLGIVFSLLFIATLSSLGFASFSFKQLVVASLLGSSDGALLVYGANILTPELVALAALLAYLSMALLPMLQAPLLRGLSSECERAIHMVDLREVTATERILFVLALLLFTLAFVPAVLPLLGMFCLGNLLKEADISARLKDSMQYSLMNIAMLALGLAIGSQLRAETLFNPQLPVLLLSAGAALLFSTTAGMLCAKLLNYVSRDKINPLLGGAAMPMLPRAAYISHQIAQQQDTSNYLLPHALAANTAGFICTALTLGLILGYF